MKNWDHFGYEEMSNVRIHEIVDPIFQIVFGHNQFVAARPLFWVRSTDAPIRQIFWLTKWKGAAIAPGWGLSLDFVPHVAARKLAWHRTLKSALADIGVEADEVAKAHSQYDMYYTAGPSHIKAHAERILTDIAPKANQFWQSYCTTDALLDAAHYSRNLRRGRMRAQINLAEAFINARYGDCEIGRKWLEAEIAHWQSCLIDDDFNPLRDKLQEAYAEACSR